MSEFFGRYDPSQDLFESTKEKEKSRIIITVKKRTGRKYFTIVKGVDSYMSKPELKILVKELKKQLGCIGSIKKIEDEDLRRECEGLSDEDEEIESYLLVFSGNQDETLRDYFSEKFEIDSRDIVIKNYS